MSQSPESSNNKYISLRNFFIFNATYGSIEGEEHKKILFYFPEESELDTKIKDIGLCEAIIKFTSTFTLDDSVHCMRTQKTLQMYYQPEPNYWMVMTINVPSERKTRESAEYNEYRGDDVHDKVFQQVLKQSYYMFRLFTGTFRSHLDSDVDDNEHRIDHFKTILHQFFTNYLETMKLRDCDILDIVRSIQYMPLNKLKFLRIHNFVQNIASTFPTIKHCIVLFNEQLVWSGINPSDLYSIHEYLVNTLFPRSAEDDLRGGSLNRSQRNSCANCLDSHYGAYLTGPELFSDNCKPAPLVHIYNGDRCQLYRMIVYSALSAAMCLFIEDDTPMTEEFYDELHTFIGPQLTSIASDIGEQFTKDYRSNSKTILGTSSTSINTLSSDEPATKYLFINELNCQHNGSVHVNHKLLRKKNNVPQDVMNLLSDLYVQDANETNACEVIVKTLNDYWIVKRSTNWRHSFIVFNKSTTLLEVAEEANKIYDQQLNDVFNRV